MEDIELAIQAPAMSSCTPLPLSGHISWWDISSIVHSKEGTISSTPTWTYSPSLPQRKHRPVINIVPRQIVTSIVGFASERV
jgi:hypothetical protein